MHSETKGIVALARSRLPAARSYDQPLPVQEDYTKEPPPAPAHLQLTLLNVPPAMDATATLPRPQHVVLNHTYCQRASHHVLLPLPT